METNHNIEEKIDAALGSIKKIQSVDAPSAFIDKTMQRMREQRKQESRVMPALLKVAAILVLALVNIYTVRTIINNEQQPVAAQPTVSDLAKDYQVSDINEDFLTTNTTQHE